MKAFKNRNIFECWMAMRRGYAKGAHLPVAPLCSASFGPFLAETRKGRKLCQFDKLKFEFRSNEPGGPNGVTVTAGRTGPNCPWGHPHKLEFEYQSHRIGW